MRLLICAGMTGGGVYPALAVLQALGNKATSVLWIGSEGGMETNILTKEAISFTTIPSAGVHGVGLAKLPANILQLTNGFVKARSILHDFRPDVIFYTGGYLSIPVALAGKHKPSVVFVPDIEPGAALNFLIKHATAIAISTDDSKKYIPASKKVKVTGYPVRPGFQKWTNINGRKFLGLSNKLPVLLVYGGSKGARSINRALYPILPELLKKMQVIHISGQDNWQETQSMVKDLAERLAQNYHPYSFLHEEMGVAFACADLVVCRAGASTLGELPYFGLPAILVPYPHAWQYQHINAEYLAKHGGAIILQDQDLNKNLLITIQNIINNPAKLRSMKIQMQHLAIPDAAQKIGELICEASVLKGEQSSW